MQRLRFSKQERLFGKKNFDLLFKEGKSLSSFPFRIIWKSKTAESGTEKMPARIGVSVPKKIFSKAVVRNRLKRRIREAYRKNKILFYENLSAHHLHAEVLFIYTSKEESPYTWIEQKMIVSLQKLIANIRSSPPD